MIIEENALHLFDKEDLEYVCMKLFKMIDDVGVAIKDYDPYIFDYVKNVYCEKDIEKKIKNIIEGNNR